MLRHFRFIFALLGVLGTGIAGGKIQAAEYHMVMFASQGVINLPRASHVFATFVETNEQGVTQEVTISWLPAPGYFGPDYMMPILAAVPGHNYNLNETLTISRNRQIRYWGPYQIAPELFERAKSRAVFLNSGTTTYKMLVADQRLRAPAVQNQPGGFINCIMAVSDLGGYLDTGANWGFAAGHEVFGWLGRWTFGPKREDVARAMRLHERVGG